MTFLVFCHQKTHLGLHKSHLRYSSKALLLGDPIATDLSSGFSAGEDRDLQRKKTSMASNTVDGRNPANPVEVGSLSHYLQGFIHPRWLFGISSINSRIVAGG